MDLNNNNQAETAIKLDTQPLWPVGDASGYLDFLPPVFQHNDFTGRFLSIFESVWEPLEQRQDHISFYFDPSSCPDLWLNWLCSWLGVSLNPSWPEPIRRAVLAEICRSYRWRGTRLFLARVLRAATGVAPRITVVQPFVFKVSWPRPIESTTIAEELIEQLKPAAIGYEIVN